MNKDICEGFEVEPGVYSGCDPSRGNDCPSCLGTGRAFRRGGLVVTGDGPGVIVEMNADAGEALVWVDDGKFTAPPPLWRPIGTLTHDGAQP